MSDHQGPSRFCAAGLTVAAVSAALLFGGCASQKDLDDSRNTNRAYDQRVYELEQELSAANRTNDELRSALQDCSNSLDARDATIAATRTSLESANAELQRLWARVSELDPMMLPQDADEALRELAASHPDLLQYDDQHGMIRFASDLTFDLGSDVVRSQAADALNVIAEVFNSDELAEFEIQIVGHTDNVPIGKPETRAKHPTNRHLSVHRAISVERVLASAGVDPQRMSVAGWGEMRPIVANPAKGGAAPNRRVEIFIKQMPADRKMADAEEIVQPTESAISVTQGEENTEPVK